MREHEPLGCGSCNDIAVLSSLPSTEGFNIPACPLITSDLRPTPKIVAIEKPIVNYRQLGVQPFEQSEILSGESIKDIQVN